MTTAVKPACKRCERERVAKWEEALTANGLTEAEWPRPVAPEFDDYAALEIHARRVHGRPT